MNEWVNRGGPLKAQVLGPSAAPTLRLARALAAEAAPRILPRPPVPVSSLESSELALPSEGAQLTLSWLRAPRGVPVPTCPRWWALIPGLRPARTTPRAFGDAGPGAGGKFAHLLLPQSVREGTPRPAGPRGSPRALEHRCHPRSSRRRAAAISDAPGRTGWMDQPVPACAPHRSLCGSLRPPSAMRLLTSPQLHIVASSAGTRLCERPRRGRHARSQPDAPRRPRGVERATQRSAAGVSGWAQVSRMSPAVPSSLATLEPEPDGEPSLEEIRA